MTVGLLADAMTVVSKARTHSVPLTVLKVAM